MSAIISQQRPVGIGAIVQSSGVAFRVWAPNATAVNIVGSFNDWDKARDPCVREDGGMWFADVANAAIGDEYQFLITNGSKQMTRIDPRARQVTNSVGNGVIADPAFDWSDAEFEMPSWNELVIYELHIGTFAGEDDCVGTFDSARPRLKHLKRLGINAVEVMPLAEFAGDYSWGYNPAHPFAVETAYGGPSALKRFIRDAHALGIAVIIDVVYNHFGPSDLDLWQFDGWSENGKGGIYFYNDWRSSTPWGETRPDYGRGEVRQYIFDNAMMWLDEYNADGLRYDMTLYMRSVDGNESRSIPEGFSLAQWINREVQNRYPGKITIAEDLRNNQSITAHESDGGANFGSQWDAQFVHPIRSVLLEINDADRSMATVCDAINQRYNLDAFGRVIYTESHDEVANGKQRVVSEIDPSDSPNVYAVKRSTLGIALMMTSPGIPMLMQGQEFLRDKWFDDTRPLDWSRAEQFDGVVSLCTDLIHLRTNAAGFTAGLTGQYVQIYHINDHDKVVVMRRWKENPLKDACVIILNFSANIYPEYRIGLPVGGDWILRFNSDSKTYNDMFDDTNASNLRAEDEPRDSFEQSATVSIGSYTCLIYSRSNDG